MQAHAGAPPAGSTLIFSFRLHISSSDFNFRFQAQIPRSDFKFRFQAQISSSDFKLRFQVQIRKPTSRAHLQISNSDGRAQVQISRRTAPGQATECGYRGTSLMKMHPTRTGSPGGVGVFLWARYPCNTAGVEPLAISWIFYETGINFRQVTEHPSRAFRVCSSSILGAQAATYGLLRVPNRKLT